MAKNTAPEKTAPVADTAEAPAAPVEVQAPVPPADPAPAVVSPVGDTAPEKTTARTEPPASVPALPDDPDQAEWVDVYCKLPNGLAFDLLDGRRIVLAGVPLSVLVSLDGARLPAGDYGMTTIRGEDWREIRTRYGDMAVFRADSPLVFARSHGKGGDAQAREQEGLRSGFEQVAPDAGQTRPEV